jgi:hypothetical protein
MMGTDSRSRVLHNPAAATLVFVLLAIAAFAALRAITRALAEGTAGRALVESPAFTAWTAFAAIAAVVFGDVLVDGLRTIRSAPLATSDPSPRFFATFFAVFAAVVVALLVVAGQGGPRVPIEHWTLVSRSLLCWGALAAGPWVVAVWSAHALLQRTEHTVAQLEPAARSDTVADLDRELQRLRGFRAVIVRAVGRLLGLVLAAVLLSGALRAALVPAYLTEEEFPASAVLLYGAFFTIALSTAVVPLMSRWRTLARLLAERAYPHHVDDSADHVAARQRLLTALGVEGALFTFPVTLTAVLAPLVTSLLSLYVPQLAR